MTALRNLQWILAAFACASGGARAADDGARYSKLLIQPDFTRRIAKAYPIIHPRFQPLPLAPKRQDAASTTRLGSSSERNFSPSAPVGKSSGSGSRVLRGPSSARILLSSLDRCRTRVDPFRATTPSLHHPPRGF